MTFSEKLITLRAGRGWSQEQLAQTLDVTRQAVGRWERGECLPDAPGLTRLARVFDVDPEWLLDDTASGEPKPRTARRVKLAWFDWLMLALAAASVIAMLCGLNMDRLTLVRNTNYAYPWWAGIVLFFRYAVWFAAGWVIAALASCVFGALRSRWARMISGAAGGLLFISMTSLIVLMCLTLTGAIAGWGFRPFTFLLETPIPYAVPGALLGLAPKRDKAPEQPKHT